MTPSAKQWDAIIAIASRWTDLAERIVDAKFSKTTEENREGDLVRAGQVKDIDTLEEYEKFDPVGRFEKKKQASI